jgi:hypothetical protein
MGKAGYLLTAEEGQPFGDIGDVKPGAATGGAVRGEVIPVLEYPFTPTVESGGNPPNLLVVD